MGKPPSKVKGLIEKDKKSITIQRIRKPANGGVLTAHLLNLALYIIEWVRTPSLKLCRSKVTFKLAKLVRVCNSDRNV